MNLPKVSIIILNWNGLEDTIECLDSLKKITYPNYKVIVVDNNSSGDDVRVLREKFGDFIHIIENAKNYGYTGGNNIGINYCLAHCQPDYFLILNNDTIVDPDFLTIMVEAAESDPSIGIAGPKVYSYHEPNRIQSAGALIHWWTGRTPLIGLGEIDRGQFDKIREVDWVSGCALLVKTKTIDDIGLLYAVYFTYFEEVDWCAKCKKAGYKVVYVPKARLWHKRQLSADDLEALPLYYTTRNRFLFMKRNSTGLQLTLFLIYSLFLSLPLFTLVSLFVQSHNRKTLLSFYRGTCDGMRLMLSRHHTTRHSNPIL